MRPPPAWEVSDGAECVRTARRLGLATGKNRSHLSVTAQSVTMRLKVSVGGSNPITRKNNPTPRIGSER